MHQVQSSTMSRRQKPSTSAAAMQACVLVPTFFAIYSAIVQDSGKPFVTAVNPFTAEKKANRKVRHLKHFSLFVSFLAPACEGTSITTHGVESGCVIGPESIRFLCTPCIFQPGNFTGWGSEGVKRRGCRESTEVRRCDVPLRNVCVPIDTGCTRNESAVIEQYTVLMDV